MTQKATLMLGRINANEDEARLIQMPIKAGQAFFKDDLLLALETSKTGVEILAPSDGRMISVFATEGDLLQLGAAVFEAEFEGEAAFENLDLFLHQEPGSEPWRESRAERKVSFKAERLAKSLGFDLAKIPAAGKVLKESDVTAYREEHGAAPGSVEQLMSVPQASQCIIVGAGGHAKSLIQMIRQAGYTIVGVTDTTLQKGSLFANAYPVLGTNGDLQQIHDAGRYIAFIGVGGTTENSVRKELYLKLKALGFVLPPLVSREATFDISSRIGEATYVFPAASVGADCVFGVNCIVNQASVTCHGCDVGDHAHIAPGAILAGGCAIGEGATIGMAATIMNKVTVGRDCLIHNNVAIATNIPAGSVVAQSGIVGREGRSSTRDGH
jgi:sugar O-acyltransferase (sialic acid O-acetyltransferase NeuD family)